MIVVMVLSFFMVYLISPDHKTFEQLFSNDHYELLTELELPERNTTFNTVCNLPNGIYLVKDKNVKNIQILVNRDLPKANREYLKENLEASLYQRSENTYTLEITMKSRVFLVRSEAFLIPGIFPEFKALYENPSNRCIKVVFPNEATQVDFNSAISES